jgi:hypothetical protein
MELEDGDLVAMAVKDLPPLLWRTFAEDRVTLSEGGAVHTIHCTWSLTTTEIELTEGKHYWEVEVLSEDVSNIFIGTSKPNLDPTAVYFQSCCTDGWFITAASASLSGNGKYYVLRRQSRRLRAERSCGFAARP